MKRAEKKVRCHGALNGRQCERQQGHRGKCKATDAHHIYTWDSIVGANHLLADIREASEPLERVLDTLPFYSDEDQDIAEAIDPGACQIGATVGQLRKLAMLIRLANPVARGTESS
jgi:hypothetical protein